MKKGTAVLFACCAFLFGVVAGFLCSPVKKGIYISGGDLCLAGEKRDVVRETAE